MGPKSVLEYQSKKETQETLGSCLEFHRYDLRCPVLVERHAIEDVGGLHRCAVMRDDDELRVLGKFA